MRLRRLFSQNAYQNFHQVCRVTFRQWEQKILYALAAGCVLTLLGFCAVFLSGYTDIRSQQEEIRYWQEQSQLVAMNKLEQPLVPALTDVPEIIEACCGRFRGHGVSVTDYWVERLAAAEGGVQETGLSYVLLRLNLKGETNAVRWTLREIAGENAQLTGISVQEIVLRPLQSEVLLRIYFLGE